MKKKGLFNMLKKAIQSEAYGVEEPKRDDMPFVRCNKCGKMVSIMDVKSAIDSSGINKYFCNDCL